MLSNSFRCIIIYNLWVGEAVNYIYNGNGMKQRFSNEVIGTLLNYQTMSI
jgi:hypothetical protein